MTRLLIHVEGQTEETFVNEVLRGHLCSFGYTSVAARLLGNARLRRNRGGIRSWVIARNEIVGHLKRDSGCIVTTMVDYYGLPDGPEIGWPGKANSGHLLPSQRATRVEDALKADVSHQMGPSFDPSRFVPFVLMHEFEGLLFSNCGAFAQAIGEPGLGPQFQAIRAAFATPEDINDSPVTAPSKRIERLMPEYEKPLFGVLAILEIGLTQIRAECPHFAQWLATLESLPEA